MDVSDKPVILVPLVADEFLERHQPSGFANVTLVSEVHPQKA